MERDVLIAVLLGVIVLVSAVQSIELMNIKSSIENGAIALKVSADEIKNTAITQTKTSGSKNSTAPVLPSNLQNLPDMVGGC